MSHDPTPRLILMLGGARSGKSAYAEALATRIAGERPVLYLATATPVDDEMRQRIARHQAARPPHWRTLETPLDPAAALTSAPQAPVILLDCVTVLIANLLLATAPEGEFDLAAERAPEAERRADTAIDALLAAHHQTTATLILVSNEVGMGVVPAYPLGRAYRDLLGRVNARLAREAGAALLLVAGIPIELKALARAWEDQARRYFDDA